MFSTTLLSIKSVLDQAVAASPLAIARPTIIAVSKQQPIERIREALIAGHRDFGENRIQEAMQKWPELKEAFSGIRLHLIGPLQSNKTSEAVRLFDVIHTVDRPKILDAIANECQRQNKTIACLAEVNIGAEPQKAGVLPDDLSDLLALASRCGLLICGLMAIPPHDKPPAPYFALLKKLATRHHLPELSMGMSNDYETAARLGATYVRIGTALFGARI